MELDQIAKALKDFESLCRRAGIPVTVQRRAVLQAVLERDDHPTAEQVLDVVKDRIPGISRTTVYRVLDTLAELGVIRRLQHTGSLARFDGRIQRHHHLICNKCRKVIDLEDNKLNRISVSHISAEGFEIEDFSVHLMGICQECRQAELKGLQDGSK
jgi:Fur family transcriptional regulator, peroxide stress response regulator